jgi:hypothetical protein
VRYGLFYTAGVVAASVVLWLFTNQAAQSPDAAASARSLQIDTVPVPLNTRRPSQLEINDFRYAGGVVLTSRQSDQLHGLSDIDVQGGDHLTAVSDLGTLFEARLLLDAAERLVGLADASITPLTDEAGKPLVDKANADAEGLAVLPGGDRLVSFERDHRIWLYPAGGGNPRAAPHPDATFPSNEGMEALTAAADIADDAYVVGAEVTGETWTCRLSSPACVKAASVVMPEDFGLVAIKRISGISAFLLRAYDEQRGARVSLHVVRGTDVVARMDLAAPMTVDNFEGLAIVQKSDGAFRFYLCSDDNASASQRTILMAFDWHAQ